jgi:hypothetical protein
MMSVDNLVTETDGLPTFDLRYRYDDEADPETVTVYDTETSDVTTNWISAAVDDTVSLDEIA